VDERSGQVGVGLLSVDVSELAVENEVASEGTKGASDATTKERVGEDGSILFSRF
jgi:hypothetical protein